MVARFDARQSELLGQYGIVKTMDQKETSGDCHSNKVLEQVVSCGKPGVDPARHTSPVKPGSVFQIGARAYQLTQVRMGADSSLDAECPNHIITGTKEGHTV